MRKEIEKFEEQTISLPENLYATIDGRDTSIDLNFDGSAHLIVFYDSITCNACEASHLKDWEEFFYLSYNSHGEFKPIFIFSPSIQKFSELIFSLKKYPVHYPVFLDLYKNFQKENFIPKDPIYHTFLLDKKGKVLLVGSPITDKRLWNLYKNTIDNLLKNKGEYKREIE